MSFGFRALRHSDSPSAYKTVGSRIRFPDKWQAKALNF